MHVKKIQIMCLELLTPTCHNIQRNNNTTTRRAIRQEFIMSYINFNLKKIHEERRSCFKSLKKKTIHNLVQIYAAINLTIYFNQ